MPRYSVTTAVDVESTFAFSSSTVATLAVRTLFIVTPSPDAARERAQDINSERVSTKLELPRQADKRPLSTRVHRMSSAFFKSVALTSCGFHRSEPLAAHVKT